ncbi:MAG TPA: hypothetical protein VJ483_05710 [Holophagaceae bacterium]|nr:hypothetical protein [Holophagaceae bacterium]
MIPTLLLPVLLASAPAPPAAVTHHQAKAHPMRYHLALPEGWRAGRSWPVVVVVPDAHRDFEANLKRFAAARGNRPFILVSPEVPTCGGSRDQTSPPYSYSAGEWTALKAAGEYEFDDAGLAAVLKEVHDRWGGEPQAFLTGWEAGGHTVWAQALRRPERWRAVAIVDGNYQGRGLGEGAFSTAAARATLPIQVFWCGAPTGDAVKGLSFFRQQTKQALDAAQAHGFAPVQEAVVPGADHGPLPEAVLEWFTGLDKTSKP